MKTVPSLTNKSRETYTARIIALCLLAALALFAFVGCKSDTSTINPAGVYTLISVNGQNVPCHIRHEEAKMIIKSGVFTITPDNTCRSFTIFSVEGYSDVNRKVKATYKQHGAKLTMHWKGAGMTIGQVQGNTFTMTNEGMIFVYRK